jgi:DNA-binding GntR family transcriptional regulator
MFDVYRQIPAPIYQQVKAWMKHQVDNEIWPEHYKLTNEIDLADELGVSRGTVRKAVSELIEEGYLVRIHGRGTFVASKSLEQPLAERLIGISEDLIEKGVPFETQVLEQSIITIHEPVSSMLSLLHGGKAFFLKRLRLTANTPFVLLHNFLPYHRCPGIEKYDFSKYRLFQVLEEEYHLELDWGRRTFQAQAANPVTAELLGINECAPVMNMKQIVYTTDNLPIELSDIWLIGEHYRLTATVKRHPS